MTKSPVVLNERQKSRLEEFILDEWELRSTLDSPVEILRVERSLHRVTALGHNNYRYFVTFCYDRDGGKYAESTVEMEMYLHDGGPVEDFKFVEG